MDDSINSAKRTDNHPENRVLFPKKQMSKKIVLKVAITGILLALNTVMTMVFAIYLPGSNGIFNIGESMVYLSAILFGPYIGAISSGAGAALADILIGVAHYSPATLLVKGTEALIVGFVYQKLIQAENLSNDRHNQKKREILVVFVIVGAISAIILSMGFLFSIGRVNISGFSVLDKPPLYEFEADFGYIFWSVLTGATVLIILGIYFFLDPKISLKIIAMITGGVEMIFGYLIYATFLYGFAAAVTEVPFNLLQVCIGILIAVPISGPIKDRLKI